MVQKTVLLILSLIFFAPSVDAKLKRISLATLPDYPPYCFVEGEGAIDGLFPPGTDAESFKGYSWDLVRESFHSQGYEIDLTVVPWPRAMQLINDGKVDGLFPTGINAQRLHYFNYSTSAVSEAKFLVYVKSGRSIEWRGLDSLRGLTIGEKRGFNYGDKWNQKKQAIDVMVLNTIEQGFGMLELGRIHGLIGYEFNWDYVLNKKNWAHKFEKLPPFGSSVEYLSVLKSNPNGKEILDIFDAGMDHLKLTGKLQELQQKWTGNSN